MDANRERCFDILAKVADHFIEVAKLLLQMNDLLAVSSVPDITPSVQEVNRVLRSMEQQFGKGEKE